MNADIARTAALKLKDNAGNFPLPQKEQQPMIGRLLQG
jgi:hypothetical protein